LFGNRIPAQGTRPGAFGPEIFPSSLAGTCTGHLFVVQIHPVPTTVELKLSFEFHIFIRTSLDQLETARRSCHSEKFLTTCIVLFRPDLQDWRLRKGTVLSLLNVNAKWHPTGKGLFTKGA
jgi:hypothetical protein